MKASRHNGRSGKHGVYDVKHNDRDFDVEHSEHIDSERTKQNVYWDCYQGYSFAGSSQERQFNFTEIERAYYYEHYSDFVDAQNERNEQARHPERNRTIDDVLKNNKTCPEESVIQLGNIDHAVTPDVLAQQSSLTSSIKDMAPTFIYWTGHCTWMRQPRIFMRGMYLTQKTNMENYVPSRIRHWKSLALNCLTQQKRKGNTITGK